MHTYVCVCVGAKVCYGNGVATRDNVATTAPILNATGLSVVAANSV